jgi:hypothetical protein
MIFVWRGWGPIALAGAILPLLLFGWLTKDKSSFALAGMGVALLAGGLGCVYLGQKWNQGMGLHSMYGVPLEVWGWGYVVVGVVLGAIGVVEVVRGRPVL